MTHEEKMEAKKELESKLPPDVLQGFLRYFSQKTEHQTHTKKPIHLTNPPLSGDVPPLKPSTQPEHTKQTLQPTLEQLHNPSLFQLPKSEMDKLAWTKDVSIQDKDDNTSSFRYGFDGKLISFEDSSSIPSHSGLFHHGDEPSRAGYTILELMRLSGSSFAPQRLTAIQTLLNTFRRARSAELNSHHPKSIIPTPIPKETISPITTFLAFDGVLLLRWCLDSTNMNIVSMTIRTICALCGVSDEALQESDCDEETSVELMEDGQNAMLLFDIKTKEGEEYEKKLEEENNTANYDDEKEEPDLAELGKVDVIAGFLETGILERFAVLLSRDVPVHLLFSLLLLFARHSESSANRILKCSRLIEEIKKTVFEQMPKPNNTQLEPSLCRLRGLRLFILLLRRNSVQEPSIFLQLSTNVLRFILLPGLFVSSNLIRSLVSLSYSFLAHLAPLLQHGKQPPPNLPITSPPEPQEKKTGDAEDLVFETKDDAENLMESLVLIDDLENNPFTFLETFREPFAQNVRLILQAIQSQKEIDDTVQIGLCHVKGVCQLISELFRHVSGLEEASPLRMSPTSLLPFIDIILPSLIRLFETSIGEQTRENVFLTQQFLTPLFSLLNEALAAVPLDSFASSFLPTLIRGVVAPLITLFNNSSSSFVSNTFEVFGALRKSHPESISQLSSANPAPPHPALSSNVFAISAFPLLPMFIPNSSTVVSFLSSSLDLLHTTLSFQPRPDTVQIVVPPLNQTFISSLIEESFGLFDRHLRSLRPYTDSILATQSTQLKKTPYLGTYNSDPFLVLDQAPPIPQDTHAGLRTLYPTTHTRRVRLSSLHNAWRLALNTLVVMDKLHLHVTGQTYDTAADLILAMVSAASPSVKPAQVQKLFVLFDSVSQSTTSASPVVSVIPIASLVLPRSSDTLHSSKQPLSPLFPLTLSWIFPTSLTKTALHSIANILPAHLTSFVQWAGSSSLVAAFFSTLSKNPHLLEDTSSFNDSTTVLASLAHLHSPTIVDSLLPHKLSKLLLTHPIVSADLLFFFLTSVWPPVRTEWWQIVKDDPAIARTFSTSWRLFDGCFKTETKALIFEPIIHHPTLDTGIVDFVLNTNHFSPLTLENFGWVYMLAIHQISSYLFADFDECFYSTMKTVFPQSTSRSHPPTESTPSPMQRFALLERLGLEKPTVLIDIFKYCPMASFSQFDSLPGFDLQTFATKVLDSDFTDQKKGLLEKRIESASEKYSPNAVRIMAAIFSQLNGST
ncbi:putative RNA polymerase II-associated protein 1 [Blattamonas nauphoetae]|uniref:RNA polymerase II-associated protein 1 n=1 Tax=Blattamonas nauphoetae TaxID=2049346 RepID=A0ABQ9YEU4_9EUKA|nr:putative RNA polymerase II-associated protein 1 [Blattamonas nauphoetae]